MREQKRKRAKFVLACGLVIVLLSVILPATGTTFHTRNAFYSGEQWGRPFDFNGETNFIIKKTVRFLDGEPISATERSNQETDF